MSTTTRFCLACVSLVVISAWADQAQAGGLRCGGRHGRMERRCHQPAACQPAPACVAPCYVEYANNVRQCCAIYPCDPVHRQMCVDASLLRCKLCVLCATQPDHPACRKSPGHDTSCEDAKGQCYADCGNEDTCKEWCNNKYDLCKHCYSYPDDPPCISGIP